jgi:hypothetical protein
MHTSAIILVSSFFDPADTPPPPPREMMGGASLSSSTQFAFVLDRISRPLTNSGDQIFVSEFVQRIRPLNISFRSARSQFVRRIRPPNISFSARVTVAGGGL